MLVNGQNNTKVYTHLIIQESIQEHIQINMLDCIQGTILKTGKDNMHNNMKDYLKETM